MKFSTILLVVRVQCNDDNDDDVTCVSKVSLLVRIFFLSSERILDTFDLLLSFLFSSALVFLLV